ncbi:MAG: hypothetical protein PHZ00_02870 [Candidatus Peribacteraceae bacterium]|nr:hypothetical protein [Candidatus Peribacteraceae bacterium]
MSIRHTILLCVALSLLFCVPFIPRLPLSMAFFSSSVRNVSPRAVREIRTRGLWLVNADLTEIRRDGGSIGFSWIYRYRSRTRVFPDRRFVSSF